MPNGLGAIFDRGVNQAFERRFNIRDDLGFNMMPELAGVVPIDAPEMEFHLGWRKYWLSTRVAAVAAQAARLRIRNPTNSNIMIRIDLILVTASAAIEIGMAMGSGNTDLTTVIGGANGSGIVRDTRQGTTTNMVGGNAPVSTQTDAALQTPTVFDMGITANTPYEIKPAVVLSPGFFVDVFTEQVNQLINYTLWWRERFLNDQEGAA